MSHIVALVGAEFEENLSLRYLAAAVEQDGFEAALIPFAEAAEIGAVVRRIQRLDPLVVGLSVPFQTRARACLDLAGALRAAGVGAHIVIGGHFATFEYANILRDHPAVDSVVRHEGELPLRDLCRRLRDGGSPVGVPGTVTRGSDGIVDGGPRRLPPLDALPFPDRRGAPHKVMGIPASPIVGSRGCYADCAFCCIYAYSENADGARYRRRSTESIAEEMRREHDRRGVRLFIFHDDNFFVPSAKLNLARYQRLRSLLEGFGMTDIALVIKCRPNDVDPELFRLLKGMGMIRAYVGIETNSDEGIVSLNRRISPEDNRRAMAVLRELDVYHSYNVLIFDPEATLEGVGRNLDFMEEFCDVPFNFCRAEVYAGTPLKLILERQGRLRGDYFAWGYRIRDPRVEVLFRIAVTAFGSRNFKHDGVANLNLGIRFDNEVVRWFHPDCVGDAWRTRLVDFSRRVGGDSVVRMREAVAFVSGADVRDAALVKSFTLELARRVARADLEFVKECKALRRELEARVLATGADRVPGPTTWSRGMPPWAAESLRLDGSTGSELSTEALPAPRRLAR
jgi:anaerobic magnesium-protoporphyrin IX monomethyl ester cyclase